jgi:hypothetical protein
MRPGSPDSSDSSDLLPVLVPGTSAVSGMVCQLVRQSLDTHDDTHASFGASAAVICEDCHRSGGSMHMHAKVALVSCPEPHLRIKQGCTLNMSMPPMCNSTAQAPQGLAPCVSIQRHPGNTCTAQLAAVYPISSGCTWHASDRFMDDAAQEVARRGWPVSAIHYDRPLTASPTGQTTEAPRMMV